MLPAWTLRCGSAVCAGGSLWITASRMPWPVAVSVVLIAGAIVWLTARPMYEAVMAVVGATALLLLGGGSFLTWPPVAVVGVALYLSWRWTMIASLLPWNARVELRALVTWRDLVVLGLAAVIGCAVFLPGVGWWTPVLGALGLVGIAALVVVFGRRDP